MFARTLPGFLVLRRGSRVHTPGESTPVRAHCALLLLFAPNETHGDHERAAVRPAGRARMKACGGGKRWLARLLVRVNLLASEAGHPCRQGSTRSP
jgi:hypothetical protein